MIAEWTEERLDGIAREAGLLRNRAQADHLLKGMVGDREITVVSWDAEVAKKFAEDVQEMVGMLRTQRGGG